MVVRLPDPPAGRGARGFSAGPAHGGPVDIVVDVISGPAIAPDVGR